MDHEEALKRLLTGGPVPLDAKNHVEACTSCREELDALRGTEAALIRVRPPAEPTGQGARIAIETWQVQRQKRGAWGALAAAMLLAGLLGGWSLGRMPGGERAAAPSTEVALLEVPWAPSSDDSTLSLLQSAYPVADRFSSVTTSDTTSFWETK